MADEPNIVFSVKELIGRLDGKLDTITNILTSKADRSDVTALEHRVGTMEEKVNRLHDQTNADREESQKVSRDKTSRRRWVVTTVISIVVALVAIAGVIVEAVIK